MRSNRPNRRIRRAAVHTFTFLLLLPLWISPAWATSVFFQTPFGVVEVDLFEETTPLTVANFLQYVNDGDYENSFIHRSVPGFIVQGGGFTFLNGTVTPVPADPPVINEPALSNIRGTIAMAKQPDDPNSATSQWFFNLADNSDELDNQNGGFTVFGQVVGDGMAIIDQIADLDIWNAGAPFNEIPLIDYAGSGAIAKEELVNITISTEAPVFTMNAGMNDAWFNPDTAGQGFFVMVFPEIERVFLAWFTYDTDRPDASIEANLGDPGHRWLTAFGSYAGNSASLEIEITEGGIFDSGDPATSQSADGTIDIEFSDCENGMITYDIPSVNRQGMIPIQRITLDNVALCEELAFP